MQLFLKTAIHFLTDGYFLKYSRVRTPDSFRSCNNHLPSEPAEGFITPLDSFLSEIDQVIQLKPRASIQSIHFCHSILSMGPSPVASVPADSEIKTGYSFINRRIRSVAQPLFMCAGIKMNRIHQVIKTNDWIFCRQMNILIPMWRADQNKYCVYLLPESL